jgi:DNA-binding SARP family transcriptional activator/predicted ATPase
VNTTLEFPTLSLLGAPALHLGRRRVPFTAERPYLLLALLACRRTWVRRDELADLLYPGRDLAAARSNLRKVLHLARQLEGAAGLEQQGDLLRWAPDSDLARFEAACSAQHHEQAVAAYGGPLLLGLDSAWPAEAAEWLHAERQRLHARWHEACTRRLAQLAGDPAAASELAQTLLRADPLDDTALQALGRAQLALGRPAEALSQLRSYEQRLSAEAGLQPSAALRALGEALEGKSAAPARPAATSSLVGRRQELAQIAQRLTEPDCRILTLLGAPGSGKSALARAAQAIHGARAGWVPLEDLQQADQVPGRVAALLHVQLDTGQAPWAALARALGPAERLLVLDNAEHLALAPGLETLLAACPGLRVLVASRMPVGMAGEWRLPISGLPLPDADETDPEVLRANDAVLLFETRARPLAPGFDLAAEAADVVRLLHEVDGLPLAIELLAAWRRLMPVREILAELAESLDLLEPATPNERSVRASFAKAWAQLGPLEQRVLAQMAALPGPLSRAQVRAVLQAPLPVVAALADRSLLRAEENGLLSLHPLIRRCAAPLATDVPALRERHARELAQRLRSGRAAENDAPHLQAAWHWAVESADAPTLDALAMPLRRLVRNRADLAERWHQFEAARAALAAPRREATTEGLATGDRSVARALLQLVLLQGQLSYAQGLFARALDEARQAHARARDLDDADKQASALATQSNIHWQHGRMEEALARIDEAIALGHVADPTDTRLAPLSDRALILKSLGRYVQARQGMEAVLDDVRRKGWLRHMLYVPINLGNLLRLMGHGAQALQLLHESLQISRTPGDPTDEAYVLTNIARIHETLGQLDEARRWAQLALACAQERSEPVIEVAALLLCARLAALQQPHTGQALQDVSLALVVARRVGNEPLLLDCVASAGVVLARCGRREEGLSFVRWAQRQTLFTRSDREDAERYVAPLRIDPAEESAALRLLPPDTPLADVLARLPA